MSSPSMRGAESIRRKKNKENDSKEHRKDKKKKKTPTKVEAYEEEKGENETGDNNEKLQMENSGINLVGNKKTKKKKAKHDF